MSEPAQNIASIQTYLQRAVLEGNLEILPHLFEPDAASYGVDGREPLLGIEGQRQFIILLHRHLGDLRLTIEDIIAVDEKVAVRFTLSGTTTIHTTLERRLGIDDDGRITLISYAIYHFAHGRIRDSWTTFESKNQSCGQRILEAFHLMNGCQ